MMTRQQPRWWWVTLGVVVVAVAASAWPHCHSDEVAASEDEPSCRLCQLYDTLSVVVPSPPALAACPLGAQPLPARADHTPRVMTPRYVVSPRPPPA